MTTSTFLPSARETADFLSKRLVLIDGEQLTKLMIRHNVGCKIEDTLHIKKLMKIFLNDAGCAIRRPVQAPVQGQATHCS